MSKSQKYKYEVSWGCCDGRYNSYSSYSLDKLRDMIDKDSQLKEWEKRVLKYGYFDEFTKDIRTSNFCIDNGFSINWYKYKLMY